MAKKNLTRTVVRRRGTTIAAAALSVALVAPFVHPVVSPQSAAEAQAQTSGTVAATPVTDPTKIIEADGIANGYICLLYTSPSPRDATLSRMPSSA